MKSAKRRKASSTRWLERQLNDPYVREAKAKGYRSRAAFKLAELDAKFRFLKPGARVLDLGAAPGGWSQVAAQKLGGTGKVVAADILEIAPVAGVTILQLDVGEAVALATLKEALGGPADVVLSDMAASTTGHRATDHIRTIVLMEAALGDCRSGVAPGGVFVGKVFQGGATGELLSRIKRVSRGEACEAACLAQRIGRALPGRAGLSRSGAGEHMNTCASWIAAVAALWLFPAVAAPRPADARLRSLYSAEWSWRQQQFPDQEDTDKPVADHLPKVDPATQAARLAYWEEVMRKLNAIPRDAALARPSR